MKKVYIMLIVWLYCFALFPIQSLASSSNFGVKLIYPEIQDKSTGESGYFMLNMEPNQKEVLEVEIINYSTETINVLVKSGRAKTSDTGLILYDLSKKDILPIDDSVNFDKMIDFNENKLKLNPHETKIVSIPIQTPAQRFSGEVLGGIHFEEIDSKNENKKEMITNKFSYSIPIIIREDKKINPNKISIGDITPALRNYHPYIDVNIQNSALSIIRNLKIEGTIYNLDKNEKWYVKKMESMQMAPYSEFNFGFDLKDGEILPGKYEVKLDVLADNIEYKLEKQFSISKEEAREKNEDSVFVNYSTNHYVLYIILIVILIVCTLIYLFYKNKKGKKKKKRKKKKIK